MKETAEILFLAADSSVEGSRALDQEGRAIQRAVEDGYPAGAAPLRLATRWSVTPLDLLREIRETKPVVLHLGGTGLDGPGGLCLRGEDGRIQLVPLEAVVGGIRAAGSARVVVLSGCYSPALADALLATVDCVVGPGAILSTASACDYASAFYWTLAAGGSVGDAWASGSTASRASQLQIRTRDGVSAQRIYVFGRGEHG